MDNGGEAHWALLGEGIVALARQRPESLHPLPPGLHRIPGPIAILAERFIDSPVGPFLSLSVGEPVRLGLRPGYFFGTTVLNSPNARRVGRQYWGFPHELGTLHWNTRNGCRKLEWEDRGIDVTAEVKGRPLPVLLPLRSVQQRSDGPVIVPTRLRSLVRRSRVELTVADSTDPLASIAGRHMGFVLSGMVIHRNAARRAFGWFATLRAPLRSAEPGVIRIRSAGPAGSAA